MRPKTALIIAGSILLLPACQRDAPPVANDVDAQEAAIEKKAAELEAQVENEVAAAEAQLDKEADAALNLAAQNMADDNAAEAVQPPSQPPP